jgi:hypothetical protein
MMKDAKLSPKKKAAKDAAIKAAKGVGSAKNNIANDAAVEEASSCCLFFFRRKQPVPMTAGKLVKFT